VVGVARKKQETLVLFPEVLAVTRKFTDEQFGALMRAAFSYRLNGEVYSGEDLAVDVAFQVVANQIDRYQEYCDTLSDNARSSKVQQKSAKCSKSQQSAAEGSKVQQRVAKDSEWEQSDPPILSDPYPYPYPILSNPVESEDDAPPHTHFSPPSIEEVADYCNQMGYSDISPDRFVSYHQSVSWMKGRTPITNWKAAVDSWHRKDEEKQNGKTESKPVWKCGTIV
jgi:hypothetical protein